MMAICMRGLPDLITCCLAFVYAFLLDLIGPIEDNACFKCGGVYYVLKSGLIQSFHTWFVDLFGMIV